MLFPPVKKSSTYYNLWPRSKKEKAIDNLSIPVRWGLLCGLSGLLATLLTLLGLPAALLLGPMIVAAIFGISGAGIRLPRPLQIAAQGVVGVMIGQTVNPGIASTILHSWPVFLGAVFSVVLASNLLGGILGRMGVLPGTTAVWGLSPGAAQAMMVMAEEYGGDPRLVAFMQYVRVAVVVMTASLVVRIWAGIHLVPPPALPWFPSLSPGSFLSLLGVVAAGIVLGRLSRVPAGTILGPLLLAGLLHALGYLATPFPRWFLAIAYGLLGMAIGLGFTREIFRHALRALPRVLLSIFALILFAAGVAALLVRFLGIDPLTAYLATSPGGMDSVAVIAASYPRLDVPFVMALQTLRFLFVLVAGPSLARFVVARFVPSSRAQESPSEAPLSPEIRQVEEGVRADEEELD
ncbi:MAG: AbrB family transcriptional regulator [Leptospirillia bacterium]